MLALDWFLRLGGIALLVAVHWLGEDAPSTETGRTAQAGLVRLSLLGVTGLAVFELFWGAPHWWSLWVQLIAGSLLGSLKWPVNPMTPSARRWLMLAGLGAGLVLGLLGVALRLGWGPRLSAVFLPG